MAFQHAAKHCDGFLYHLVGLGNEVMAPKSSCHLPINETQVYEDGRKLAVDFRCNLEFGQRIIEIATQRINLPCAK